MAKHYTKILVVPNSNRDISIPMYKKKNAGWEPIKSKHPPTLTALSLSYTEKQQQTMTLTFQAEKSPYMCILYTLSSSIFTTILQIEKSITTTIVS